MELGMTAGRFFAGAIITTLVAIGGVWTVVGLAVSGMTAAVDATNSRVGDIQSRLTRLEDKIDALQVDVIRGFRDTQTEMKKASLDTLKTNSQEVDKSITSSTDDLKSNIISLLYDRNQTPVTLFLPPRDELQKIYEKFQGSGLEEFTKTFAVPNLISAADLVLKANASEGGYILKTMAGTEIKVMLEGTTLVIDDRQGHRSPVADIDEISPALTIYETAPK